MSAEDVKNTQSEVSLEQEYSEKPVPDSKRSGWTRTASIYAGNVASMSWAMTGGALITGLAFWNAIAALVLGLLILIVVVFIPVGKIGMDHGFNTYINGEACFGKIGSNIATALIVTAIPCIGWYGVQVSVASTAVSNMLGIESPVASGILCVIVGVIFILPSISGTKMMAWLNYLAIPAILIIIVWGTAKAISVAGSTESITSFVPTEPNTILWGINMQIGAIIVGSTFVSDYTRWQKKSTAGLCAAGFVGMLPIPVIMTVTGLMMGVAASTLGIIDIWNPATIMTSIGMPAASLILIILLQWSTCISASYSGSLALEKMFHGKRWIWTVVVAVLGCVLAISGIINHFMGFLGLLAEFVAPVVGVLIAEYYIVSKQKLDRKEVAIYWPGLISWAIGDVVAHLGYFIPALTGIVASFIVYTVWHLAAGKIKKAEN